MLPPRPPPETSPPELSPQQQFQMHYRLAQELWCSGRGAEAAKQYQLALQISDGWEGEHLAAKCGLGQSFLLLGHYAEALEAYSAVFQETWHRPEFHHLAYQGLFQSIDSLHCIQRAKDPEEEAPLHRRLALIEEGLRWLRAIDKASWRSALMGHKADTLWALGERTAALAEAEAAFQVRRKNQDDPGYALAVYCAQVARFARQLGEPQRGLQAIETLGGRYERPTLKAQVLGEQARLLLALNPPQKDAALVAAQRAARRAKEIQFPRVQLEAYMALGQSALAQTRFSQAEDALHQASLLALGNTTPNRPYLLREARRACQEAQDWLVAGKPTSRAKKLQRTLEQWRQELDHAFLDHSGQTSEGKG